MTQQAVYRVRDRLYYCVQGYIVRSFPLPVEELRDTIDLVVVAAVREGQEFVEERIEPGRFFGQQHFAGFDAGRCRCHAVGLVAPGLDTDGAGQIVRPLALEILDQVEAQARLLDQDGLHGVLSPESDHLAPQVGVFEPAPPGVEEVAVAAINQPGRADRVVAPLSGRARDIPALDDAPAPKPRWTMRSFKIS